MVQELASKIRDYFHVRTDVNSSLCLSGSGLLWCWGFLRFFWSQTAVVGEAGSVLGDLPYLGSTLLVSLVVAIVASHTDKPSFRIRLAVLGCLLIILGVILELASRVVGLGMAELGLLSKITQGGGIGVFFIAWGCLYVSVEPDSVEHAFMGWCPILIALLLVAAGINYLDFGGSVLYPILMLLLPVASLACLFASEKLVASLRTGGVAPDDPMGAEDSELTLRKDIVWPLANLACVFSATSLAWNAFLGSAHVGFERQLLLFAVGIAILFVIIWIALRTTRRFSLSTLYRWALPFMAIGVVVYQLSSARYVILVFLCLSIVNTGFEVMGKLFCIYVAKRKPSYAIGVISIGFATASIGGIVGTGCWAWALGQFGSGVEGNTLLVALVVFVVSASLALGNYDGAHGDIGSFLKEASTSEEGNRLDQADAEAAPRDDDTTERCLQLAQEYGLSARELEVLVMLSQGRSRALIRETLYISKGTVDTHIHHIYSKIGVSSKDELMRLILDERPCAI